MSGVPSRAPLTPEPRAHTLRTASHPPLIDGGVPPHPPPPPLSWRAFIHPPSAPPVQGAFIQPQRALGPCLDGVLCGYKSCVVTKPWFSPSASERGPTPSTSHPRELVFITTQCFNFCRNCLTHKVLVLQGSPPPCPHAQVRVLCATANGNVSRQALDVLSHYSAAPFKANLEVRNVSAISPLWIHVDGSQMAL